jgi:Flp pilus assembly pilin Flp
MLLLRTYTWTVPKFSIGFDGIERYSTRRTLLLKRFGGVEPIMKTQLRNFVNEEQGQDLIEYTLLLAFVCLATSALFVSSGGSLAGIWTAANTRVAAANTAAS